ncbi:2-nitropropane dioxygenase [Mycena floridula]|nr:2-nitropropane dioxygenase [Mycena floridula]
MLFFAFKPSVKRSALQTIKSFPKPGVSIMSRIHTKVTQRLGIRTPVIAPPMAGASGGALAAEVSLAGGFGLLSGHGTLDALKSQLNIARNILNVERGASLLPVGVGYLCWYLERPGIPAKELLEEALENRVQAVWFAFGKAIPHWIQMTGHKTNIFVQITSVEEAKVAINDWKVDFLVAQGGHGSGSAPPLRDLKTGPPLIAAGGLSNGSDIASFLNLGTSAAVLGTRFLLAPESFYTDSQRKALIAASGSSTVRTMAFDHARGTLEWPEGVNGRGLRNATVDDFEAFTSNSPPEAMQTLKDKYAEAVRVSDTNRCLVWAGTGVASMTRIQPARVS